jgi:hypothetical protein
LTAYYASVVLHVATVHNESPRWVEIQTRYLREHIHTPYRTWASLEGIDRSYAQYFDNVLAQKGTHPGKLNHLAMEICHEAQDDDLIMFLDGDSFPIADPLPLIDDALSRAPLVAVRRAENLDDPQPHPCFCVTTVQTWRALPGDWSQGYEWTNALGKGVSDTGANLLRALQLTNTPWVEVLRSNRNNLDPLFFAVYGDTIYHHGAGFRGVERFTRLHASLAPKAKSAPRAPIVGWLRRRADWRERRAWDRDNRDRLARLSNAVLAKIQQGNSDWLAEFV